jgi:hypothetical protein
MRENIIINIINIFDFVLNLIGKRLKSYSIENYPSSSENIVMLFPFPSRLADIVVGVVVIFISNTSIT